MVKIRHLRHRLYERVRHSSRLSQWLAQQATRIGVSAGVIFGLLRSGMTSSQIDAQVAAVVPSNTVLPTITGTAKVGVVLTASKGTWLGTPTPTYTYQWKKAGVAIAGQTATTYTPVTGDIGAVLSVTVTGVNFAGSASASSANTAAVVA